MDDWKKFRERIFVKMGGRCAYCGRTLKLDEPWHADHQKPRRRGGGGGDNLVPACPRCNLRKSAYTPPEFKTSITQRVRKDMEYRIWNNLFDVLCMMPEELANEVHEHYRAIIEAMTPENITFFYERFEDK